MKLFLPQKTLEEWVVAETADLRDGKLVIAENNAAYPAVPAVHFQKVVSGVDEKRLVARVKTEDQLRALGAEHMSDSVLLGDTAYEVAEGFITEVASQAPKAEKSKPAAEADMLAAFLLNKMT